MENQAKKYLFSSMPEALDVIKSDLGEDAYIITTNKQKGSDMLEIYACSPENMKKAYNKQNSIDRIKMLENQVNAIFNTISKMAESINNPDTGDIEEDAIVSRLHCLGLDDETINDISSEFDDSMDDEAIKAKLIKLLDNKISHSESDDHNIFIFIGPTGVGKTTTLSKIASEYTLINNEDIATVNLDVIRQGAKNQFEKYSNLLTNEMHKNVIYPSQLRRVIKNCGKKRIFIDTSGRSQFDENGIMETYKMIEEFRNQSRKILVLSAVTKYNDLKDICEKFSTYGIDEVVFTKIDETSDYGNIYSILYKYGFRIKNMGCGQEVPKDIKKISSAEDIVSMMFEKKSVI